MKSSLRRRAFVTCAAVISSMIAGAGIVGAAGVEVNPTCSGSMQAEWPGWGFGQQFDAIYSHTGRVSLTIPARIPVGTYDVVTATYDGGEGRAEHTAQDFEQLFLQFLDEGGAVIDATEATPDLADLVREASWGGPVGRVVLDRETVAVRAYHAKEGDYSTTNSLMPVCFGVELVAPPTTTTTGPPTEDTTTTTTVSPTTTLGSSAVTPTTSVTPTTTVSPTTLAPTSTTAPTDVRGISVSPPAQPVTLTPTFTG